MASRQATVDFILEQITGAGMVRAKKMFGEYGIYCDEKFVALVCDDRFFIKPTEPGRAFIGACTEAQPYPEAKPWLLIDGDKWDERDWLADAIRITAASLPMPKEKKPRKPRG